MVFHRHFEVQKQRFSQGLQQCQYISNQLFFRLDCS